MVVEFERRNHAIDYARGKGRRSNGLLGRNLDNGKLIASEAGYDIALPDAAAKAVRNRLQQFISDRMTQGIVDSFEPVEIETEHSKVLFLA
jgi:hypothetical protein